MSGKGIQVLRIRNRSDPQGTREFTDKKQIAGGWGGSGLNQRDLGPPKTDCFLNSQKQCQNAEHPGGCEEEELTQPRLHLYASQGQCAMALDAFETKAANLRGKAGLELSRSRCSSQPYPLLALSAWTVT